MRAAVCRAFGAPLTIERVTLADPGPDEVRVKMTAVAICHSDITLIDGGWGGDLPAVFGHDDEHVSGRYPLDQINEAISSVKAGEALRNVIVF